ncbi:NAD(+)/NADH kinase [Halovivax sp.]|uniref:NAD(+)/NADH kinase n=1 Tax=Halovivax sp. TaxID=1935978 RepID=UPI0025C40A91|nr:NAD(+)/NADH kinase [Halovivax sp.]
MDPVASECDDAVVGLVGEDPPSMDGLRRVADAEGVALHAGGPDDVLDREPVLAVTVGDKALAAVARRSVDVPILAVDCERGVSSTPRARAADTLVTLLRKGGSEREAATLTVVVDGTAMRAVFDVALVTAEPGKISAFDVRAANERLANVRADGVVVATPAGSRGYARTVGGPTLGASVEAVAVVPISPFVTDRERWVVAPDDLTVTVERDESAVSLQVDGRVRESIDAGQRVTIDAGPSLTLLCVDG